MPSLECRTPKAPTTPAEMWAMRKAVWHKQGIAVIPPDEVANDWDRQHIVNVAEKLYGKRSGE